MVMCLSTYYKMHVLFGHLDKILETCMPLELPVVSLKYDDNSFLDLTLFNTYKMKFKILQNTTFLF